jgi:HAMP domain-containing protein
MKNQRKNYFVKPGFQTKLTVIILLIVVIVANIVGGVIYGLLSGSTIVDQIAKAFEIDNYRDLLLPVILFAELVAIIIVTFIGVFVSHTMAGPVYRFEKVLDDVACGELDSHFNLRTSDEFQDLAGSINNLIGTLNSKVAEIKVYSNNITNLMNEIDSPKAMTVYDIENIKNTIQKLSTSINYFKMIDVSPSDSEYGTDDGVRIVSAGEPQASAFDPGVNKEETPIRPAAEKRPPAAGAKLASEDLIGGTGDKKRRAPKEKIVNAKTPRGGESKKRNTKRG